MPVTKRTLHDKMLQLEGVDKVQENDKTTDDMVRDLWHWAFGNGRPGVEARVQKLENNDALQATRDDIGCSEDRMDLRIRDVANRVDALSRSMNVHEVIKLAVIIAAIVAASQGIFTGV